MNRTVIVVGALVVAVTGAVVVTWPREPGPGDPGCAEAERAYERYDDAYYAATGYRDSLGSEPEVEPADRARRRTVANATISAILERSAEIAVADPSCFGEGLVDLSRDYLRDRADRRTSGARPAPAS